MKPGQRALQLEERLIDFTVLILSVAEHLPNTYAGRHFGNQIIRSGSSPALHYGEARGAESRKDFRHKLSILLKELRETHINLRIIQRKQFFKEGRLVNVLDENNQLISIFTATIKSIDARKQAA